MSVPVFWTSEAEETFEAIILFIEEYGEERSLRNL